MTVFSMLGCWYRMAGMSLIIVYAGCDVRQAQPSVDVLGADTALVLTTSGASERVERFGDFLIENHRSVEAEVKMQAKSCSCLSLEGLPVKLQPGESARISMLAEIGKSWQSRELQAMVSIDWEDGERRVQVLEQRIKALRPLCITPATITFAANETQRKLKVIYRYRSTSRRRIDSPIMDDVPEIVRWSDIKEVDHRQLNAQLWEVEWEGTLRIARQPNRDSRGRWRLRCTVAGPPGERASGELAISLKRAGVKVVPSVLYIRNLGPKRLVLASLDDKPFRIYPLAATVDGFQVTVDSHDLKDLHSVVLLPQQVDQGRYLVTLKTSHPSSPEVTFDVVVPSGFFFVDRQNQ